MSCNAKMPIYGLFAAAFFGGKAALVYISMYVLVILCGLVMAFVTRKFLFKGEAMPFVMELPNYRMPTPANVARLLWDKAKDFVERAFSVIFIATLVIWFLQTFSLRLNMVSDSKDSILAAVAGVLTPLLKPLGFADWRICVALIAGFMAKESVVSTLTVLFGSVAALQAALSPAAAIGLLVFCLLYTPCVAAVSSFKRELGGKWALGIVAEQCLVAWIAAFIVRLISLALGLA
jgi:ferrous iron transport protein B